jgi:tyrosyl-tRNA synthetase
LTPLGEAERARVLAGHPRVAKARLAREITARFHGEAAAGAAAGAFDRQFRDREVPDDVPEHAWRSDWPARGLPLAVLLRELGLASSSSEARRAIEQGGVRLDGEPARDPSGIVARPSAPLLVQVGRRRFARLVP